MLIYLGILIFIEEYVIQLGKFNATYFIHVRIVFFVSCFRHIILFVYSLDENFSK
jgi:hypothetical protein